VLAGEKTVRLFRRRLVAFVLLGLATAFCKEKPPEVLAGDGVHVNASRDVAPFSRVSVGSRIHAEIAIGKPSKLELEGDRNLVALVTSHSENGTLTLNTPKKVEPAMPLRARISVPSLDSAHATNGGVVDIRGLAADKFEARVERAGKVNAKGSAQTLVLEGKGAGAFDFKNVAASSATVRLELAATAQLGYLEKLDVKLRGGTFVHYEGTPEIKKDIQPPSRLIKRDQ
jgi:hypothetical protein